MRAITSLLTFNMGLEILWLCTLVVSNKSASGDVCNAQFKIALYIHTPPFHLLNYLPIPQAQAEAITETISEDMNSMKHRQHPYFTGGREGTYF